VSTSFLELLAFCFSSSSTGGSIALAFFLPGPGCHFAHGESELRKFPRQEQKQAENPEYSDNMFSNQEQVTVDYFQGGVAGGGQPSPIVEPDQAHFFIILAATQRDLAISTVQGTWYVQRRHAEQLNHSYQDGAKQVMLFFTVSSSEHIQGGALMTSRASYLEAAGKEGSHHGFDYALTVKWYRTTELPAHTAKEAAPDLIFPSSDTSFCQTMSSRTGEALMKAVWNSPLVTLHESWTGDKEPPSLDAVLIDFRAPLPEEIAWPIMPGPGTSYNFVRMIALSWLIFLALE
jgi:cleavage and polyadenylation specificity factor subunit 4